MTLIKTQEEIAMLREAGKRHAAVLKALAAHVAPGVSTKELDELAERLIRDGGDTPSFLGYHPPFADTAFPASVCTSINEEIVHGIPSEDRVLQEGDIIGLDLGLTHKGMVVDAAVTVPVGAIDDAARRLLHATREALHAGIKEARAGNTTGDIGAAIAAALRPYDYGVPETLGGHGVGHKVHEDPDVPNHGVKGKGERLQEGMVLALEPMANEGTSDIKLLKDGYTVISADGSRSAHFEHTIVITDGAAEVLTRQS